MNPYYYFEVCAMTPPVAIGDPLTNAASILELCKKLPENVRLVVTPELSLTGYTCQDLFYESLLQTKALKALDFLCDNLPRPLSILVGLPLQLSLIHI